MAERVADRGASRRGLLEWFIGTTAGAFLVATFYPLARYLVPPEAAESAAASVTLPLKVAEVRPNSGHIFKLGNRPGILVRTAAGEFRAFSAVCTHLNCTVQFRPDLAHIWCACHNGHFDLNGINVAGPPPRPLDPLVVNVRGDHIVVSRGA